MTDRHVTVRGDLDLASAPRLRASLREAVTSHAAHVLLDCKDVTFIDSSAVSVILEAHNALEAQGRYLLVANLQPSLYHVFQVLGLEDLLRYDRTTSDLLGDASRPPVGQRAASRG